MATDANIKLPDNLLAQAQRTAQAEGTTADDFVAEATERLLQDRFWERNKREAAKRRGNMTDTQVQEYVDRVIHEHRAETRGR